MFAHRPTLGNICTKPLESQGLMVQILAHLHIVWPAQKIIWLSLFDETKVLDFSN